VPFPGAAKAPFRPPTRRHPVDVAEQAQLRAPRRRCGVRQHPPDGQYRRRSGSLGTLRDAVAEGTGSTILPWSVACQIATPSRSVIRAISSPKIEETVSVCVSDQMPLSEAAVAIRNILLDIAQTAARSGRWQAPKDATE
jgi:DNA-binding transcriptional LysR family regulator